MMIFIDQKEFHQTLAKKSLRFINSVIKEFQKDKESFIIPPNLLESPNLSYPLKYSAMNSMKLNQNIFE